MKFTLRHAVHLSPATFWQRVFFDDEYNRLLYVALGFADMRVLSLDSPADGKIRRVLRAEPPINLPMVLKRKLQGKVFYTEQGHFEPATQSWAFQSIPSVLSDQMSIQGRLQLLPHPEGSTHVVDLDVRVTAWGMGPLLEGLIERNARDSFATTVGFTNRWAEQKGLV